MYLAKRDLGMATTIDIFDALEESEQPVARVTAEGDHGHLEVFDKSLESLLEDLFTSPRAVGRRGQPGPDGSHVLTVQAMLQPWQEETLEYVLVHELPKHQLLGVRRSST